jgi:hypothetical protein
MEKEEKETIEFYQTLEKVYNKEKEYYNIIMGDWNAKIGEREGEEERLTVGKFGLGSRNENGDKMVQFAIENNLKVANTFFKKRKNRKWTWLSPDENVKNEIDHLLTNDKTIIYDVDCIATFKFPSDHRPIRSKIKIPQRIRYTNFIKRSKKEESRSYMRKSIPLDRIEEVKTQVKERMDAEIKEIDPKRNLQEYYEKMVKVLETVESEYGKPTEEIKTNDKLSQNTKKLIEKREKLKQKSKKSYREKVELVELRKLVKRKIREDIRNYNNEITRDIIESCWSTRKMRNELREEIGLVTNLKDEGNRNRYDREKIINIATQFYKKLYEKREKSKTKKT